MTSRAWRKTALIALIILLSLSCVLFACACGQTKVVVDFTVEGELVAGSSYSFNVTFTGMKEAVAEYEAAQCTFEIISGDGVASIEDNKLKISDAAHKGDAISVMLTVKGVSAVKTFTVAMEKPILIDSVTLLAPERAEAGQVIPLSATVLPEGVDILPVYRVISGSASIEGNLLKIAEDADVGVVVVEASAGGIVSPAVTISITTVQTRTLTLSLSRGRALPGEWVNFTVEKTPAESSYPIELSVAEGEEIALLDKVRGTLSIEDSATIGSEIVLVAHSGAQEARATLVVGHPAVTDIEGQGGIVQADYTLRTIEYAVIPAAADRSSIRITVEEGEEYIEWTGGDAFRVLSSAPVGSEITFLLEADEDVYHTITYKVGNKELTSLSISTSDSTAYLRSGYSVTFNATTIPADAHQAIYYRATTGADLVRIDGNVA